MPVTPAPRRSPRRKAMPAAATAPKVGFVSLGCPKALVDSERILTQLRAEGYQTTPSYDSADVVVINTCGFIDEAVAESLDAIGEAMAENGKVVVTGCLGASVKSQLIRDRFPNVLSISGPQDYASVMKAVHAAAPPRHDPFVDLLPAQRPDDIGIKLTPRHYAYLKISEGCNHRCSFCIIPSMRGRLSSRPVAEVLGEAERLVKSGVQELLVISQDTSAYGVDLKYAKGRWRDRDYETRLLSLCEGLSELDSQGRRPWIRLHYVYPYPSVDQILPLMAERRVLPYLDIPFQHASPRVLKAMKRPAAAENTLERIRSWRRSCPDLSIRSSFIVGFPGETEADFQLLLDWLDEAQLDRVGCFQYSAVDGASANALAGAVPDEVKEERYHRFMQKQALISAPRLQQKIGRTIEVLVDEINEDAASVGRSWADAPEIDGKVYIQGKLKPLPGQRVKVRVVDADDYDLYVRLV